MIIINDGEHYAERCDAARKQLVPTATRPTIRAAAEKWAFWARDAARKYDHQFSEPCESHFTTMDIIGAALELCEYYQDHVRETDALAAAEAA